ncbi:DNA-directed RNA polymerase subunit omega [candidate division KSB1 bacterium]|nr:DNA-directed RNA polymerase subunit omega [candidate division KSB1 bacterium]
MIDTLSVRDLEAKAANIYEAIIVLSRRARQINSEQKLLLQRERGYDDDDYEIFEDDDTPAEPDREYLKLPKPSALAIEEYLADKLRPVYRQEEEKEEEAKSDEMKPDKS